MVYFTLGDAPRIQTIPFYISNQLRNLALVMKDDPSNVPSVGMAVTTGQFGRVDKVTYQTSGG
jgi:hypothetical protein